MAKFTIKLNQGRQYYWVLTAANGEPICWSEAYSSRSAAIQSAKWVKANAFSAIIIEL